jgi:hypothetical protein
MPCSVGTYKEGINKRSSCKVSAQWPLCTSRRGERILKIVVTLYIHCLVYAAFEATYQHSIAPAGCHCTCMLRYAARVNSSMLSCKTFLTPASSNNHPFLLLLQACPTGTSTLATGATSAEACHVTLAGYQAILDNEQRVIGAVPCLVGTYSPEGADVCYPCPAGLTTQVGSCKHLANR